ncbi:MAG: aminoacyl-tRNA hydrolase [Saprospiraceae bacterium]|nr:aminoacyl-tRNA hydrolase [Saprospiraceae bacterium]
MELFALPDLSSEFLFQTSRSSGPGGQHVNKTESRVELRFNVVRSQLLSQEQIQRIISKLHGHLSADEWLIISAQRHRSQFKNKKICIQKFETILTGALIPDKIRIKTKPGKKAKMKRLGAKRRISELKKSRSKDYRNLNSD